MGIINDERTPDMSEKLNKMCPLQPAGRPFLQTGGLTF
jgi:hypothetical protein